MKKRASKILRNASTKEAIGKRKVNVNATNHIKPWFFQEDKELSESQRNYYLNYKSAPSEETYAEYVLVNARIRSIKSEHLANFTSDIDHQYGAQRKV